MVCEESVNLGYTCHHLAKNHLYSHLLSISMKRLYRTVILHVVFLWVYNLVFHTEGKH